MNKSIVFLILSLTMLSLVSATSLTVNSIVQKDRSGNIITSAKSVGDQIYIDINVEGNDILNNLRYPYVSWSQPNNANAWVSCNSKILSNSENWNWLCILTVTPQMSVTSDVYIKTNTRDNSNPSVLLGTWDFRGIPFPQNPNCVTSMKCSSYQKNCIKVCTYFSNRLNRCISYKNICNNTDTCIKYSQIKICTNR